MKYKLLDTKDFSGSLHEKLLGRSGVSDPSGYINIQDIEELPYDGLENINEAYALLMETIDCGGGIGIIADADADGTLSSSMLFNYLGKAFGVVPKVYFHENKEHGIDSLEEQISNDYKDGLISLLIVPDAGTNDVKQCKMLNGLGLNILILDHHISEKPNNYAVIVNPQISPEYPNKDLSGTGVVYKFLQKIDDEQWSNYANDYRDMVALSIISDSMNIKTFENRWFIHNGLKNIKNRQIEQFVQKQSYSMGGEVTINGLAFYVIPLINAVIRAGSMEEKELMFKGFSEQYEEFDYTKRDKSVVKETIYERAVRLATNAKSRQERIIDKALIEVERDIEENNRNKNKILFCLANDEVEKTLTGLVAQKLASKYNKPCLLLRSNGRDYYSGSARNFRDSPLTDLKGFIESLNSTSWQAGHPGAFGTGMSLSQLKLTINRSNEALKDFDFSKTFLIDFEFDSELPEINFIKQLYDFRFYVGQGINEPVLLIKNFKTNSNNISSVGKTEIKTTWKISVNDDLEIIKFKCSEDDEIMDKFCSDSDFNWEGQSVTMDLICRVGLSEYNGKTVWNLVVDDYVLKGL